MKTIIVLAVIALAGYLIYRYVRSIVDKITFKSAFKGVDLGGATLASLLAGNVSNVKVTLSATITNANGFSIPFNNLKSSLFFEGTLVADTTGALAQQRFTVPANGTLEVTDTVNVYINSASIKLLSQGVQNTHPEVAYTVSLSIYSIPVNFDGKFNY